MADTNSGSGDHLEVHKELIQLLEDSLHDMLCFALNTEMCCLAW